MTNKINKIKLNDPSIQQETTTSTYFNNGLNELLIVNYYNVDSLHTIELQFFINGELKKILKRNELKTASNISNLLIELDLNRVITIEYINKLWK